MPTVTFAALWPLALLAALPLVWLLAWRNRAGVGRARMAGAAGLRSLALAAIVAALMRPTLHRATEEISVIYALDVSSSVSARFLDDALNWIAQVDDRYRPAQSSFVAFADHARLLSRLTRCARSRWPPTMRPRPARPDASGRHQSGGSPVDVAPAFAPGHAKRIVLLSDGNQTEGDVWRAMLRCRPRACGCSPSPPRFRSPAMPGSRPSPCRRVREGGRGDRSPVFSHQPSRRGSS
jgi:hypothetical protein